MAGINPGFAAYLASKKSGKAQPKQPQLQQKQPLPQAASQNVKSGGALPQSVFNSVPGLPNVGKRHAKVKTAKNPHKPSPQ